MIYFLSSPFTHLCHFSFMFSPFGDSHDISSPTTLREVRIRSEGLLIFTFWFIHTVFLVVKTIVTFPFLTEMFNMTKLQKKLLVSEFEPCILHSIVVGTY